MAQIRVAGFNGIVGTIWADAFLNLTKCRSNDGGPSSAIKPKFECIVNRVIGSVVPDKGKLFCSGLTIPSFEMSKT